ncbi:flavo protein [Microthyrium microscopicum]|uniref:Flavo protein n=1 Tax=Microthyrium microscopicum TaxID=703497 RepID=A0A6A6TY92_9PEZI|nr:flavo protein [Microthyrium microscopicum]
MSTSTPTPFDSSLYTSDNKHHLLLAATGSVATIKIPNIITALSAHTNLSIRLIMTSSAAHFLGGQSAEQPSLESIAKMPNVDGIYFDADEYAIPWTRGAKILHIELRRWADLLVIAPLSANSLGKMAGGLCDNLLLSTVRAWDVSGMLDEAHAMNTAMWFHPLTAKHLELLEGEWNVKNGGWVEVMRPIEKTLACGDTGSGAMKDWNDIVTRIEEILGL